MSTLNPKQKIQIKKKQNTNKGRSIQLRMKNTITRRDYKVVSEKKNYLSNTKIKILKNTLT